MQRRRDPLGSLVQLAVGDGVAAVDREHRFVAERRTRLDQCPERPVVENFSSRNVDLHFRFSLWRDEPLVVGADGERVAPRRSAWCQMTASGLTGEPVPRLSFSGPSANRNSHCDTSAVAVARASRYALSRSHRPMPTMPTKWMGPATRRYIDGIAS